MNSRRQDATEVVLLEAVYNSRNREELEINDHLFRVFIGLDDDISYGEMRKAIERYDYQIAKQMLANWINAEYGKQLTRNEIPDDDYQILYTELGDHNQYPVEVFVNMADRSMKFHITDQRGSRFLDDIEQRFDNLDSFMDECLEWLDFCELMNLFEDYIQDDNNA